MKDNRRILNYTAESYPEALKRALASGDWNLLRLLREARS